MDSKGERGFIAWCKRQCNARPKTPPYYIVLERKGVPVLRKEDDAAIASLRDHPGMVALLNRLRLQRAFLESKLLTVRHEDIRNVDLLQSGCAWSRYIESEVTRAVEGLKAKNVVSSTTDEVEEFERIKSAIESVTNTQ